MLMHWPKRVPKLHKHVSYNHPTILLNYIFTHVSKFIQTLTRHKFIPKTTGARNCQNTSLAKKKSIWRISIVRWAWLLEYTSSPNWNLSRSLLHAMQPPRTHGQKPSRTIYRIIYKDRMWAIMGGQDKNDGKLTSFFSITNFVTTAYN